MTDEPETDLTFTPRIGDMASEDRPRERLALTGAAALNNAELLAILLAKGIDVYYSRPDLTFWNYISGSTLTGMIIVFGLRWFAKKAGWK